MKIEILTVVIINLFLILLVLKINFKRIAKKLILIQMSILTMYNLLFLILISLENVQHETANMLFIHPFWILHFPLSLTVIPMFLANSGTYSFLFFETGLPGIFLYWFYVDMYYKMIKMNP